MASTTKDTIAFCVKERMKGGDITKERLAESFGLCRGDFTEDIWGIIEEVDFTVKAHTRKGRYVQQFEKKKRQTFGGSNKEHMARILWFAIHQLKQQVSGLEKDLAKAFKAAEPESYKEIIAKINIAKDKINRVRAELSRRGAQDVDLVGRCDDCKKEKALFYQKLCKECYGKRVKNYVDKYDMDENKLRAALKILERETEGMNSQDKETYYRAHLMPYFATGMIKANAQKLAQNDDLDSKTLHQYPYNVQRAVQMWLNVMRWKLEDIKDLIYSQGGNITLIDKEGRRHQFETSDFTQQDASIGKILGGGIKQKLAEKKQRSIFFKPFRPLETLHEITQTAGKRSSSNVVGMEYSDGMLKVTFNWEKLGEVEYGYDVGPEFYENMAKAPSKGKFVWSTLRGKSPGYVIDNPAKTTPGGVGGSLVPYTKITKRKIQGKEFKKLQKHYAGMLKGKVKVVAHMPFVRKKQKVLSRESKPFKNTPGDFVLIKIATLSDTEVEGHYRTINGKKVWIPKHSRAGEAKKAILAGVKSGKIKKTSLPKTKSQEKEEKLKAKKEASTTRRAGSEEEKRRREIDKQARAMKAPKPIEPREAAIQKLIEETGLERGEAEKRIAKLMGLSPEQAKQKAETKQREEKFKVKHEELGAKLTALHDINKKIQSAPLRNLLKLLLKGFMLLATGKDPKAVLNKFKSFYVKLQKEKKLDQNQKKKILLYISGIHKEMEALSKSPEDFEYISAAVDVCAKRKVAQSGGKGNYKQYVAECIRMIGISRRKAGLSRRSGGTAKEVRRGQRRVRTQTRRTQRGARREWEEAHRILQERREARRTQREGLREEARAQTARIQQERELVATTTALARARRELERGNNRNARSHLDVARQAINAMEDQEAHDRWLQEWNELNERVNQAAIAYAQQVQREREEREAIQTRQEALTALRQYQVKLQRYMREPDFEAAQTIINLSKRKLRGLESIPESKVEWTRAVHRWQEELDVAKAAREGERAQAEERIRELASRRGSVREARQRHMQGRNTEAVAASTLNESEAREASEVMHIEIPVEPNAPITPEQYRMRFMRYSDPLPPASAQLTPPPGMQQTRRGGFTRAGIWRNPTFRTPEQIATARETARQRARISGRHAVYTGQTIAPPRETARQQAARRHRRRRGGVKMRWRTRISLGGRNYRSLSEISRADLQHGQRLELNPVAKRDYDFPNPDFDEAQANRRGGERPGNMRRIVIRKGESAGTASFRVQTHSASGTYLYLATLKQRPDFRGRGASSILKPAIMWADSQNMVIGGSPSPIGRESEVAPAHLNSEERRRWRYSNSADLKRFYKKLGGFANVEYGGSFARFPHPERISRATAGASDLVRKIKIKLDVAGKKLIFFKNPKVNIAMIGGYHFYYDPEKDLFYQLDT